MRNWGNSLADASADVSAFTPIEGKGYDSYDSVFYTDTGMVIPANLKAVLDFRPIRTTLTITIDAVPASLVEWEVTPSGAGVVAVNYLTGELAFHASDLAKTAAGSYKHLGTVIDQHLFNKLQLSLENKAEEVHEHEAVDVFWDDGGMSVEDALIANSTDHATFTSALSLKQPLDSDLTAIAALASTGLVARTGTGTAAARTITAGTDVSIADGDGVAGNPTISLGSNVAKKNTDNAFSVAQTLNGLVYPPKSITTTATLLTTDYYHLIYATSGSYTITMPTASAALGQVFLLVVEGNHATNVVTLDAGVGNNMSVPLESFGQTITIDVTARRRWYLFRKVSASLWLATAGS